MSLAKYNGTCKECGAPIHKGRTDIRARNGRSGRETVCAYHVTTSPHWDAGEPCDAYKDAQLTGDWSLMRGVPR
jgi:hypothetical protein